MFTSVPSLARVEDTAAWAATSRAVESAREDALFHDRLAGRFVGTDKDRLLALCERTGGTWPVVARTVLIDRLVLDAIAEGADAVLNLAAGYDTRALRLVLPRSLVWMDIDHAEIIATRRRLLEREESCCQVESHAVDLADRAARAALFDEVQRRFSRVVVVTEGLLYYLTPTDALELARDLHTLRPMRWIFDLHNGALNAHLRRRTQGALSGTAQMQFGPDEGPAVFEPLGWTIRTARSTAHAAAGLGRLPLGMTLLTKLPSPRYGHPRFPWAGACSAVI